MSQSDNAVVVMGGATVGSEISGTIRQAISYAIFNINIKFEFNGVTIIVAGDSDPNLILRDWRRAMSGFIDKQVGPYPPAQLSQAEIDNDARLQAIKDEESKQQQAELDKLQAEKKAALQIKLDAAGPIDAIQHDWQGFRDINSKDSYSNAAAEYAEVWARLMQYEMSQGKKLEDIAEAASHEADVEGITGFMYGMAVSALSKLWRHGEALRRWHNLKYQLRGEGEKANQNGGVINPAVLTTQ